MEASKIEQSDFGMPRSKLELALVVLAVILAVVLVLGFWHQLRSGAGTGVSGAAATQASQPAKDSGAQTIATPKSHAEATPAPAQASSLEADDALVLAEIARLSGSHGLFRWFFPTQVIRHIVATVDALPRRKVPLQALPTRPIPGQFQVEQSGDDFVVAPSNAARYVNYVQLLKAIDPKAATAAYHSFYPLFQQAYRALGYPNESFNHRLTEAIDSLLAAPNVTGPLRVEAPRAMWQFADPDLEELTAGQKILLRMGHANSEQIRTWLHAFQSANRGFVG